MTMHPTNAEQVKVDESRTRYLSEREEAIARYVQELTLEVAKKVCNASKGVPYVTRDLYFDDTPEGHKLTELADDVADRASALKARVDRFKGHAETWAETDGHEAEVRIWDAVRLARAGDQQAVAGLLAAIVRLGFALDQWSNARYVWVDERTPAL